jgi:hypothetical protein
VNNVELTIHENILTDYSGFVNRLILTGSYPALARALYLTLRTEGDDAYVDDGYVDIDYVDETGGIALSESLYIRLGETCVNNPVYLAWLNPTGAFDYWLFINAQDHQDVISNEQKFERYVEDLSDAIARESTLSKESQEEIIIGAQDLNKGQAEGLRHMLASPLVLRFIEFDSVTGLPKWQRVGVKSGSFMIDRTDETKAELICTISPPQKYIQEQ